MTDRKMNGAIVRIVKNKNYTVLSNVHLKHKELSFKAKGLMSVCLSLPDNWNYTVVGLQSLASDGRASIESALKELENFGFLKVERERDEKGLFKTIYTFFENPFCENPDEPDEPDETTVSSTAENPQWIIRSGLSAVDNQQQLNTNNKILKENFLKKIEKSEKSENLEIFEAKDVFAFYKKICKDFPQPSKLTAERIKKTTARLKTYPKKEFWEEVFKIAQNSPFLKGEKGVWFNYDWLMKNDNNALKVFEGNYGGKNYVEKSQTTNNTTFEGDKYSKKYGG